MARFQKHAPKFVDSESDHGGYYSDAENLLDIRAVAAWKAMPGFSRFSILKSGPNDVLNAEIFLMAEMESGDYHVVGYLSQEVDLPLFRSD